MVYAAMKAAKSIKERTKREIKVDMQTERNKMRGTQLTLFSPKLKFNV